MKKVLLFSAQWCGPCKSYKPAFDKFVEDNTDKAEFEVCDVDKGDIAATYRIRGVPTAIILEGDSEVQRASGVEDINKMLHESFSSSMT
jgi:thioredoxin 1